jgi:hypothetical protein
MKPLANYLLKTAAVTAIAVGMSMAFASSASADEVETDIAFEDQVDPAYVEYLLELGSSLGADNLNPEEELLREETERAARDARMVGFEERLSFVIDMYMSHPEYDGGVRSVADGIMYFSTTEAGYEYYSKELKSMIDDGYIVMDATFDMHWPTAAEVEAAYWAARSAEAAAIEEDEEISNSEPTEPILEDEQEISYPAIEPALTSQAEESTVTWFAYGPEGTENGIDWSRLYYQFALLSMLTLPQPGSSLGVTSGLLGSGQ